MGAESCGRIVVLTTLDYVSSVLLFRRPLRSVHRIRQVRIEPPRGNQRGISDVQDDPAGQVKCCDHFIAWHLFPLYGACPAKPFSGEDEAASIPSAAAARLLGAAMI